MMKSQILMGLIAVLTTITNADKCDRTQIGNEFYKRQLIATIDGYPTNIVVDPRTEHMFFLLHKRNYTKGIYLHRHGSLGIRALPISDELIGHCVAVDKHNNIVYIGTNRGLVVYDYSRTEITAERTIGEDDIRNIYIDKSDNQIYISTGTSHEIYRFVNNMTAVKKYNTIPKAYSFVKDSKDNAFYEYIDGRLYFLAVEYYEPIQYKGFNSEHKYMVHLNGQDDAVVAVKESLFKLTTKNILPEKIGNLGIQITSIAFDSRNNLIVGTTGKIYRYKPIDTNDPCPVDDYFMSSI